MTREEAIENIKAELSAYFLQQAEANDDYEPYLTKYTQMAEDVKTANNLNELAKMCQNSAFDWPGFVEIVLKQFGFSSELSDFGQWMDAHGYGWST